MRLLRKHATIESLSNHDNDERHKFAYLTTKNNVFFNALHVQFSFLNISQTFWNELFGSCVDDETLSLKRWFQFNSRIVRKHFASIMTWNNWEIIAETRSYTFRWRSRCRWLRLSLSFLFLNQDRRQEANCSVSYLTCLHTTIYIVKYEPFSRNVTAAMLVKLNKGTAAMLVSQLILWELNSFLMETLAHWSREWKHSLSFH